MDYSSNFLQRITYGTLFTALFGFILFTTTFTTVFFVVATYFVQALALREFFDIIEKRTVISSQMRALSYIGSSLLYILHGIIAPSLPTSFLAVSYIVFMLITTFFVRYRTIAHATHEIAHILLSTVYITIPFLFAIDLAFFPLVPILGGGSVTITPPFWLLISLVTIKGCDTTAYFCGKLLGKTPLAINISPKKTIEGAIGGIFGSIIGFWLTFLLFLPCPSSQNIVFYTLFSIFIGALSQVSDLVESLFKRDMGVKDSSRYIPGLGGMLDMIDSLLITFPCIYGILFLLSYYGII